MATPYTLKQAQTFRRQTPSGEQLRTVPAGTTVRHERNEVADAYVHTFTVTLDGYTWTCERTQPKAPAAPTVVKAPAASAPAPSMTAYQNAQASESTHKGVMAAAARTAAKEVSGTDAMDLKVDHEKKMIAELTGNIYQVNYYIPVEFNAVLANPSRVFRRHAIHMDGSNWVFTEKGLNHPDVQRVFAEFRAVAATQQTTAAGYVVTNRPEIWDMPYHPSVVAQVRAKAEERLRRTLINLHTSLIERIAGASDRLQAARNELPPDATEGDRAKVEDAFFSGMRGALRDAVAAFEDALEAAEAFDERENLADLFRGIRQAIRAEAIAFNVRTAAAGRKPVTLPKTV